jgi:hypothetical protein
MKKVTIKNLENLVEIPENVVRLAAAYIPEDEESGLRTVLQAAEEYTAANLTPIFILDQDNMDIMVVCKETFGKRLH